jgi:hypothetical protein
VVVAFLHVAHRGGGDEVDKARGRPTTGATCAGSDRILSYRTGGSGAYMESDSEYLYVSKEKKTVLWVRTRRKTIDLFVVVNQCHDGHGNEIKPLALSRIIMAKS